MHVHVCVCVSVCVHACVSACVCVTDKNKTYLRTYGCSLHSPSQVSPTVIHQFEKKNYKKDIKKLHTGNNKPWDRKFYGVKFPYVKNQW